MLASVIAWPMTSPLPRRDSATADSTEFSFAGSMDCDHRLQVLEHGVDLDGHVAGVQHRAGLERLGPAPSAGTMRSTYLAPNAVLDLISASTLLGRYWNGPGSIFRFSDGEVAPLVGADGADLADLDAAQLDLGAVLHDQAGPVGDQRERDERARCAGEQHGGQRAQRDDHQEQHGCIPDRIDRRRGARFELRHRVTPTGGSCRTARRRTA